MSTIKIYNRTGYQYLSQNWSEEVPDVMKSHPLLILKKDNIMNKQIKITQDYKSVSNSIISIYLAREPICLLVVVNTLCFGVPDFFVSMY